MPVPHQLAPRLAVARPVRRPVAGQVEPRVVQLVERQAGKLEPRWRR